MGGGSLDQKRGGTSRASWIKTMSIDQESKYMTFHFFFYTGQQL